MPRKTHEPLQNIDSFVTTVINKKEVPSKITNKKVSHLPPPLSKETLESMADPSKHLVYTTLTVLKINTSTVLYKMLKGGDVELLRIAPHQPLQELQRVEVGGHYSVLYHRTNSGPYGIIWKHVTPYFS